MLLFMRLPVRGNIWTVLGRASFGAYLVHFPLLMLVDLRGMPSLSLPEIILACGALSLAVAAAYQLAVNRLARPVAVPAPLPVEPIDS